MNGEAIKKFAIEFAQKKAKELGELNNSITKGKGNLSGFIGEFYALGYIGGKLVNTFHYDIVDKKGKTWDVKTKQRTVPPREDFFCSVAAFNIKQKCDNYVFVSLENLDKVYVLGWLPKEEFYKKAFFGKQGQVDPNSPTGQFKFRADCYNIKISELRKF